MNWNAIKTFILGSGIIAVVLPHLINAVTSLLGCSGDNPLTPELELSVCTGGSLFAIPAWLQTTVAVSVIGLLGLIKTFAGTGTLKQNLLAPDVPVVPKTEAKPGVVTIDQVNSGK